MGHTNTAVSLSEPGKIKRKIATEPNVNDVSSDVIEEEPAAPDVEDGTGDDSKREANQSFAKFNV